jgi:hypothetical protein
MSVPVPNRGQGELEVNTKARALTVYTLKILENEKWFPQTQRRFIEKLQDCVIEIQALCWEANEIKVNGNELRYRRRLDLQDRAAEKCNRMAMLIETAHPLFHLHAKRIRYWMNLTITLRNYIRGWHEKDVTRLKPKEA